MRIRYKLLVATSLVALSPWSLSSPLTSDTGTGQASVEINGVKSQLSGSCNVNEVLLQFWTDGKSGAAQRDVDGDGEYLDVMAHSGMRALQGGAMLQLMSGKEWIYKGVAKPAVRDGSNLTLEHSYTRNQAKGGGDFDIKVSITCGK